MSSRCIYIHVGLHKTGTTAIQQLLFGNRKRLAEQGLLYPGERHPGRRPDHFQLALLLADGETEPMSDPYVVNLCDHCRRWDGNILLSSEGFTQPSPTPARRLFKLLQAIRRPGDRFRVIIYFRRQDLYLEAAYKQFVRQWNRRRPWTMDEFLRRVRRRRGALPDYWRQAQRWRALAGRDAVAVHIYEKAQLPNGLLADFLSELGLPWDDALKQPPRDASNVSLSSTGTELLRQINALDFGVPFHNAAVAALTERDARSAVDEPALMSLQHRTDILKRYAAANRRVARRYLERRDGCLFLEPIEPVNHLDQEAIQALEDELPAVLQRATVLLAETRGVDPGSISLRPGTPA